VHASIPRLLALFVALAVSGCYLDHTRPERHDVDPDPVPTPEPTGPAARAVHLSVDGQLGCAIGEDARVRCWGQYMGFVYSSLHDAGASPTIVPGLDGATALAVSSDHACAVLADESVWCWGFNTWGQLGLPRESPDLSDAFHEVPVRIEGLPPARSLAMGWLHSCALLTDGGVACWGNDGLSEMPVDVASSGALDYSDVPIVAPGVEDTVQLDAHGTSTCARRRDGTVRCWGENAFGEDGPIDEARVHTIDLASAIDVATMGTISRALLADGTVVAWGAPTGTVPGDGSVSVLGHLDGAVDLVTIMPRVCALDAAGVVACLPPSDGTFGVDALDALVRGLPPAREVAFGFRHVCFIDLAGQIDCLGQNGGGELGSGLRGNHLVTEARVALHDASHVERGADFACALAGAGLYCWGGNGTGDLGLSTPPGDPSASPRRVSLDDVTDFSVRAWHACAVVAGDVYCWGQNDHDEIAPGGAHAIATPTHVPLPSLATRVAVGNAHVCAVASGDVYCWGDDSRGQAADGRFLDAIAPVRVTLPDEAVDVAAGNDHTCAALATGDVYCWGENHEAQTGAGFCSERCIARLRAGDLAHEHVEEIPVHVPGVTGVTELRAIARATCGAGSDGLFCWPSGESVLHRESAEGFLGEGNLFCSGSPIACGPLDPAIHADPVPMIAMEDARDVVFDSYSGCAIDGIGDVRCWGAGERGQLGNGDGYSAVPLPVRW
jgi:alpha-tubulin suppressor-like RCC1 family protein